jgi:hypothetical protein
MKKALILAGLLLALTAFIYAEDDTQFLAADQTLMIMPTAYTMPKRTSAFTNFELFLLQYTYAYNDRIHLSAAMVFPVVKDAVKTFTLGTKINYLRMDKFQSAVWLSYNQDSKILSVGNVNSYGTPALSAHVSAGIITRSVNNGGILEYEAEDDLIHVGFGLMNSLSKRASLITELHLGRDSDFSDTEGLLLVGLRFKGKTLSWDLGGFRPVSEDMGDLIALPFVKATILF